MSEIKEDFTAWWESLDEEDKQYFTLSLASIPAYYLGKFIWLKRGAPKWAAKAVSSLGVAIAVAPYRYAYNQRVAARKEATKLAKATSSQNPRGYSRRSSSSFN